MYVKTDYTGCEYVTAGKVYVAHQIFLVGFFDIKDDCGSYISCRENGRCLHLHGVGTWTICDKEGNEL